MEESIHARSSLHAIHRLVYTHPHVHVWIAHVVRISIHSHVRISIHAHIAAHSVIHTHVHSHVRITCVDWVHSHIIRVHGHIHIGRRRRRLLLHLHLRRGQYWAVEYVVDGGGGGGGGGMELRLKLAKLLGRMRIVEGMTCGAQLFWKTAGML